jgi:hypothetical protein
VINPKALLADLKMQVKALEIDLRSYGVKNETTAAALNEEWQEARKAQRTAASYETWLEDRVTQVAVAWVLGTVFVRFCEDNKLIELPVIAGLGSRLAVARERQTAYFQQHPERTDRHWIIEGFDALSVSPVAAGLFERHNPMRTIDPSHEAAKALLDFWRRQGPDGEIIHDFDDPDWNTRFLGDLYQDLSEHAKKTYALLQTPEFVEEFILNYTLDPAIKEFGLEPEPPYGHAKLPHRLRVIDPACGSGHFLLGAFHRLLKAWEDRTGDTDKWDLIVRALESIHGVDKNPFAAAIARFRLMLAAMQTGDVKRLSAKVDFPLNIAVGDSLIHGHKARGEQMELEDRHIHTYRTEDIDDYINSVHMLAFGSYHVVVANPPYITVKDKLEGDAYREMYPSCHREYSLSVPFAERIFKLAILGAIDGPSAGFTGQITANSFMKREFGKKLIEQFFQPRDLTHVIDTSGAYIPGHGTPTVILMGRNRWARRGSTIRAVLGVRGEPTEPPIPAEGLVWQAIVSQIEMPGSDSEWVSVVDLERDRLAKHPWSLSGGGAVELFAILKSAPQRFASYLESIGFMAVTREDDAYLVGFGANTRMGLDNNEVRPMSGGTGLRDWSLAPDDLAIFPYVADGSAARASTNALRHLWRYRRHLAERRALSGTQEDRGLPWFVYSDFHPDRWASPYKIGFAFVSTHNHYVMVPPGHVLIRSAPMIKLPEGASEDDHLKLLGVLNSSTACFWLKQVSHPKGNRGGERSTARYAWEGFYEFTGTKLQQFPLPADLPLEFGRELDGLAQKLSAVEPSAVCAEAVPTRERLDTASVEHEHIRGRMIALQEELDWDVYRRYGLLSETEAAELIALPESVPELRLSQRAFEIRLAQDGQEPEWFRRHGSKRTTEIPGPDAYKQVVARRIEVIKNRPRDIGLIERPECKRRWQSETWEKKERAALRSWLLDRCEDRALWFATDHQGREQPKPMTVSRLADRLRGDADVVSVARLLHGPDADLADVVKEITADEHVPYLARLRYASTGLLKRVRWEQTWDLQREEDEKNTRLDIPVPPKYKKEDFLKTSYWNQRGKLDVPKERFISYPGASPNSDDSLLLGWVGWDHREQAHALIMLIEERSTTDGWDGEQLKPLLAGLLDVMPWVRQWHGDIDPAFGASPAHEYDTYLTAQREKYGLTEDDLHAWKPAATGRGRRRGGGA